MKHQINIINNKNQKIDDLKIEAKKITKNYILYCYNLEFNFYKMIVAEDFKMIKKTDNLKTYNLKIDFNSWTLDFKKLNKLIVEKKQNLINHQLKMKVRKLNI